MDANEYYLEQYLQREEDEQRRWERAEECAEASIKPGGAYYPFSASGVMEALCELDVPRYEAIANLLARGETHKVGELLWGDVREYWFGKACDRYMGR